MLTKVKLKSTDFHMVLRKLRNKMLWLKSSKLAQKGFKKTN